MIPMMYHTWVTYKALKKFTVGGVVVESDYSVISLSDRERER